MIKKTSTMMKLGFFFLIVANLSMRYLHLAGRFGENLADFITGVFFGLAIGLLLWSAWLNGRRQKYSCS